MARTSRLTDEQFTGKYHAANNIGELSQLCGASAGWVSKRMKLLGLPLYPVVHWRRQYAMTDDPTPE